MPKTVIAIRHVPFEDLGSFEGVLAQRDYRIQYVEAGMDDVRLALRLHPDVLVILGGPIGAYEDDMYPFLRDEFELVEQWLKIDAPLLGICLGSQIMARALGARVYPGNRKEIGWAPIRLTEEGSRTCLRHLGSETRVLHWHGDTFDRPHGAVRLASTALYENQAFSYGKRALALQFHPEVTPTGLERWFIGHACELATTKTVSVKQLREETSIWGPRLHTQGVLCFEQWLQEIEAE